VTLRLVRGNGLQLLGSYGEGSLADRDRLPLGTGAPGWVWAMLISVVKVPMTEVRGVRISCPTSVSSRSSQRSASRSSSRLRSSVANQRDHG
jgi:hypothetical protein